MHHISSLWLIFLFIKTRYQCLGNFFILKKIDPTCNVMQTNDLVIAYTLMLIQFFH